MLIIHWTVCPLHVLLKSKSKNTKTRRQNMTTTHSGTVTNEQKNNMASGTEQYLGKINECSRRPQIKIASRYISSRQGIINYQPTCNCFQKLCDCSTCAKCPRMTFASRLIDIFTGRLPAGRAQLGIHRTAGSVPHSSNWNMLSCSCF